MRTGLNNETTGYTSDMKFRRTRRFGLKHVSSAPATIEEVVNSQIRTLSSDALPALLDGGGLVKLSKQDVVALSLHPDYKDVPLDFLSIAVTEKLLHDQIEPNSNRRSGFRAPNDKYSQGWTLSGVHFKNEYSLDVAQLSHARRLWPLIGSGEFTIDKLRLGFHHVHKVLFSLHYLDSRIPVDQSNIPLFHFFFLGKRLYRLNRETARMYDEYRTSQAMYYWLKHYKFFYNLFCEGSTIMIARISRTFKVHNVRTHETRPIHGDKTSFTGRGLDVTKPVTSPVRSKYRRHDERFRSSCQDAELPVNTRHNNMKKRKNRSYFGELDQFETQMLHAPVSDVDDVIARLNASATTPASETQTPPPLDVPVSPAVPKGWLECAVDSAKNFVSSTISDAALKTLTELPALMAKGVTTIASQGAKAVSSFVSYMMTLFSRLLDDFTSFAKTLYDKVDIKFICIICMVLLCFVIYQNRRILQKVKSFIPFVFSKIGSVVFNTTSSQVPDFTPLLNDSQFETQMGFSTLVPLVSCAVSIAFATIDKSYLISSNAIVNFLSRAPMAAAGVEQSLKDVFDYCYFAYYKEHFFVDKNQHDRMQKFYEDYLTFTAGKTDDALLHEIRIYGNVTEALEKLHSRALAVKADLPYSQKLLGPFYGTLMRVVNDVIKLHTDALSSANYYKTRIETPLIWLYGKPGQGKTALIPRLSHAIYQYIQHSLKDPKYSADGESHVLCADFFDKPFTLGMLYNRSTVDPFWEGYEQQFCCVWNELFACADPKTNMVLANELLTACEKGTYSLNMAFEGKGRCFFSSMLAFVTSNVTDSIIRNQMSLTEPAALVRRRTLCLEVEKDEKFVLSRVVPTKDGPKKEYTFTGNYDEAWKMTLRYPTDVDFQEAFKLGVPSPWKEHAMAYGFVEMRFTDVVLCLGDEILSRMVSHAKDTSELSVNHLPAVLAKKNGLPADHPLVVDVPTTVIETPQEDAPKPPPPKPVVPPIIRGLAEAVRDGNLTARQFSQATGNVAVYDRAFQSKKDKILENAEKLATSSDPKKTVRQARTANEVIISRKPVPPQKPSRKTTKVENITPTVVVIKPRKETPTVSIAELQNEFFEEVHDFTDGMPYVEYLEYQNRLFAEAEEAKQPKDFETQMYRWIMPKWWCDEIDIDPPPTVAGIADCDEWSEKPFPLPAIQQLTRVASYDGFPLNRGAIKWPREKLDLACKVNDWYELTLNSDVTYCGMDVPHTIRKSFMSPDRDKRRYLGRLLRLQLNIFWASRFHLDTVIQKEKRRSMIMSMTKSLDLIEHSSTVIHFLEQLPGKKDDKQDPLTLMLRHFYYLCSFTKDKHRYDHDERKHLPDDLPTENLHMFTFLSYRRKCAIPKWLSDDPKCPVPIIYDETIYNGKVCKIFSLSTFFRKNARADKGPQSSLYDAAVSVKAGFIRVYESLGFGEWLSKPISTNVLMAGLGAMLTILVGGIAFFGYSLASEQKPNKNSQIVKDEKPVHLTYGQPCNPDLEKNALHPQSLTRDKIPNMGNGVLHPNSLTRDKTPNMGKGTLHSQSCCHSRPPVCGKHKLHAQSLVRDNHPNIGKGTLHSQLQEWGGPFLRYGEYPDCETGYCYCFSGPPPCTIEELWDAATMADSQEYLSWSHAVKLRRNYAAIDSHSGPFCPADTYPLEDDETRGLNQCSACPNVPGFEWKVYKLVDDDHIVTARRLVPKDADVNTWIGPVPNDQANCYYDGKFLHIPFFVPKLDWDPLPEGWTYFKWANSHGMGYEAHKDGEDFDDPEFWGFNFRPQELYCKEPNVLMLGALNTPLYYKPPPRSFSTQSGIDAQINLLAAHIRGLSITVMLDGVPQIIKQYGVVSGHRIFTSAHFMDLGTSPTYLSVTNHGSAVMDFFGNQLVCTRAKGDRDLLYIDLPKTVNAFPTIKSKMFANRSDLRSRFASDNVIFRVRKDGGITYRENGAQSLTDLPPQYGSTRDPDYRLSGHYGVTQLDGFSGYCGLPYFTYTNEGKVYFLGIHVGASGSSPGAIDSYFTPVFQDDLPVFDAQCKMPGWLEIGVPNTSAPDLLFDQQTILLGSVKPKFMPTKTMLVPSVAQGNIAVPPCYPMEVTPASLAPNKAAGYHPLKHTMPKLNKAHCRPLPNRLAHYALHEPDRLFAGWFPKHMNRERLREWTIWEALFGESVSGWTGTEQSTAVGPDIEHCIPTVTSLFQLWGKVDDDYWKNKLPQSIKDLKLVRKNEMWIHPVLYRLVMDIFVIIADGHEPKNVVAGCHKDELRPDGKKLPDGNVVPRLFCIGSKSHQIATIMVMGSLVMNMKSNRSTSDVAIGDNPHGFDWKRLMAKLQFTDEDLCFAGGDVSGMDTSERSWMGWLLGHACCRMFAYAPGTFAYRKVMAMCKTALAPLLIIFDHVYWLDYFNSSGGWLTGFLNSFCSIVMFNYSLMTCQDDSDNEEFRKAQRDAILRAIFYGDDNVWSILKKFIEYFNMIIFASIAFSAFGITYTTPSKGAITEPHSPLDSLGFLARSFRRDGERVYAPLEPSSIYGMVLWVKKPKQNATAAQINAQFCENVETAMKEWFHHGREVFDREEQRLMGVCRDNGLPYLGKSYAHYESRWLAGFC